MTIWKGNEKLAEGPGVWMDIANVRKMYERSKSLPLTFVTPPQYHTTPPLPDAPPWWVSDPNGHQWEYPPVSWTEANDYVTYVHGWNASYDSARCSADTTFKRLWQRGYKGRFAALYWPTLVGFYTYNESEYRAWYCGESLRQYVDSLPAGYRRLLVAHSMGNIVAGSALRKGLSVESYALIAAAVPASCYDPSPTLHQPFGANSPDHDTDPQTLALAYRDKLAGVGGNNLINFYLLSDSALFAWQINQELYRPEQIPLGHAYYYESGNPSGQKLFFIFPFTLARYLGQMEESLGYAAKSSTSAVGAEDRTGGSVAARIDCAWEFGYENEHSAFWVFTLQRMKLAYDRLMDELAVERNP